MSCRSAAQRKSGRGTACRTTCLVCSQTSLWRRPASCEKSTVASNSGSHSASTPTSCSHCSARWTSRPTSISDSASRTIACPSVFVDGASGRDASVTARSGARPSWAMRTASRKSAVGSAKGLATTAQVDGAAPRRQHRAMRYALLAACALGGVGCDGCGDALPPDVVDATVVDLAARRDLSTARDLAAPDFATPDLATPDLAEPDLAMPDLTTAKPDFAGCPYI